MLERGKRDRRGPDMPAQDRLRDILFVLRVTAAAALSYLIAAAMGLDYPSWASVSAIIVSQEKLSDTRSAAVQRLAGTLAGVAIAVLTGVAIQAIHLGTVVQMSAGVALTAWLARRWPQLKVAMWTVPIVYLSNAVTPAPFTDGLWRGVEVLDGGTTGAIVHFLIDALFRKIAPPAGSAVKQPIDHPE